jgi:DNA-binding transcriptional regulator YhcF (GntR family)
MAVLFRIDEQDPKPLYLQLSAQVKDQIRKGSLLPDEELPSIREVARTLGVNLHTVHRAYQTLRDEGVILLRVGRRPRIAPFRAPRRSPEQAGTEIAARLNELITDAFHLGLGAREFRALVAKLLRDGS